MLYLIAPTCDSITGRITTKRRPRVPHTYSVNGIRIWLPSHAPRAKALGGAHRAHAAQYQNATYAS